jgi:uncharacterized 2Fe-2S/4Fe-4S cluster protein (DUF4445 family)
MQGVEDLSVVIERGEIRFHLSARKGASLLNVLRSKGIPFDAPCGGEGRCGRCLVRVEGELSPPTQREKASIEEGMIARGWRLACQATIEGPVKVFLPFSMREDNVKTSIGSSCYPIDYRKACLSLCWGEVRQFDDVVEYLSSKVPQGTFLERESLPDLLRDLSCWWKPGEDLDITLVFRKEACFCIEQGNTLGIGILAACDIGTTTISAAICDAFTGKTLGKAILPNPQGPWGSDIVSRMSHALSAEEKFEKLRDCLREGVREALLAAAKNGAVDLKFCYELNLVGNPVMQHFFMGFKPIMLSRSPFIPLARTFLQVPTETIGAGLPKGARIHFLPSAGGFVGADLIGVLLSTDIEIEKKPSIVMDLGTNGEIALLTSEGIVACSTAAGPAFEGGNISSGTLAIQGAIDRVFVKDGQFYFNTIGNGEPIGICGSGIIEAVSWMLEIGLLSASGRLRKPEEVQESVLRERVVRIPDQGLSFVLYKGKEITIGISQNDIRELQLAKGAMRVGLEILLEACNITWDQIEACYLAGTFGNSVSPSSLSKIGLFPETLLPRVKCLGNAALNGAFTLSGRDRDWERATRFARSIRTINLESWPNFQDRFISSLAFA